MYDIMNIELILSRQGSDNILIKVYTFETGLYCFSINSLNK